MQLNHYEKTSGIYEMSSREFHFYNSSPSKTQYLLFVHGEALSYEQAIQARCFYCGLGKIAETWICKDNGCPLHSFKLYNEV